MEKKVNIILNCFYYGFYLLIAAVAVGMWQAVKQQMIECISPMTTAGQIMQYIVICYVIVSVAGGLYCFKKIIDSKKVILSADKEGLLLQYRNWGVARITAIGFGAVLGIVAFYLMGGYNSMLWCAAISTIGLYFCKPTLRKQEIELTLDQEHE